MVTIYILDGHGYSKLILMRLMKTRFFVFFLNFQEVKQSQDNIRDKTRGIALISHKGRQGMKK